jgi:pectate lyase
MHTRSSILVGLHLGLLLGCGAADSQPPAAHDPGTIAGHGGSPAPDAGRDPSLTDRDAMTGSETDAASAAASPDSGAPHASDAASPDDASPGLPGEQPLLGYATLEGGTTGGSLGTAVVTVHSGAELQSAVDAKGSEPLTILVEGHLTHSDWRITIKDVSDLSIVGVGADAELDGFALDLTRAHNVVIRNLRIHHVFQGEGDAIRITDHSHHVWVDHCELYSDLDHDKDYYDGLLDVTHGSDLVTVSWNVLRDHHKVSLLGHTDDNADEDLGALRVTFHHNLFERVGSRLPSVRFGRVHGFDNLYRDVTDADGRAGTAVSSRMGACVRLENNRFDNVNTAVLTDQSPEPGAVELIGNELGGAEAASTPSCALDVPYPYLPALEPAASLGTTLDTQVGVGVVGDATQFTTLAAP